MASLLKKIGSLLVWKSWVMEINVAIVNSLHEHSFLLMEEGYKHKYPKCLYASSMRRHECSCKLLTIATFPSPKTSKPASYLVSSVNLPLSSIGYNTRSLYFTLIKNPNSNHSQGLSDVNFRCCVDLIPTLKQLDW